MDSFTASLEEITSTARHLAGLNVMDISFYEDVTMEMYIAINSSEKMRGLAGISSLDVAGMLFVYPQPTLASFTMEGMEMDLDVAFYNEKGRMIHIGRYETGHLEPIHPWPQTPFSYVVEAPAGTLPPGDLRFNGR